MMARIWRTVPSGMRRRMLDSYGRFAMPRLMPGSGVTDGTATVVGAMRAISGVSEGARLCHGALAALGVPVSLLDVTSLLRPPDDVFDRGPAHPLDGETGSVVVHLNPPHFAVSLAALGRRTVARRKVIGYWAWELPIIPAWWRNSLGHVHELWVPSTFVADAIRASGDRRCPPIVVVPHPVAVPVPAPLSRARFDIPADAFVVLCVFHMAAGFARKNPLGALRAFRQAFGDDPAAQLVIAVKEPGIDPASELLLRAEAGAASNIRLLSEKWTRPEMNALLAASDVVLSLHRAEGFGLVLAEAMQLGKPAVATGWSGNLEFMTQANACLVDSTLVPVVDRTGPYAGAAGSWAEPDVDQAAGLLRGLFDDPARRATIGKRARREAAAFFGLARYRERIAASIGLAPSGPRAASEA